MSTDIYTIIAMDHEVIVSKGGGGVNDVGSISTEGVWDCVKAAPQIAVVALVCNMTFLDWLA